MRCGSVLIAILTLILSPLAQADTVYLPIATTPAPTVQWGTVTHIVDGDTLDVTLECCECIPTFRVRLLAIDTPERGECFYSEAKAALGDMVDGQRVGLERDTSEWDSFGRLLRHVYAGDVWVNAAMVTEGYALVCIVGKDRRYAESLWTLEDLARTHERGGWAACPDFDERGKACEPK